MFPTFSGFSEDRSNFQVIEPNKLSSQTIFGYKYPTDLGSPVTPPCQRPSFGCPACLKYQLPPGQNNRPTGKNSERDSHSHEGGCSETREKCVCGNHGLIYAKGDFVPLKHFRALCR